MLNLSQLISDFEACIGFPYASPGTNDERGIDYVPIFSMTFSVMTEVTKPPGFVGIISREC